MDEQYKLTNLHIRLESNTEWCCNTTSTSTQYGDTDVSL